MAARLLARLGKKAPTAANDLLRHMRRVFRFAVRRHLIASSPVADFNLSDAGGQESARQRSLNRDELERLMRLMVQRQIEPTISQTLPLSEARAGFEAMLEGQTGGKIVFMQYPGPTTRATPIYAGRMNLKADGVKPFEPADLDH